MIAPGPIEGTEGSDRLKLKQNNGEVSFHSGSPVGRIGDVRDIGNATVFLFSDAASFITGQVIPVDGGIEHLRTTAFPYPQAVLDPTSVQHLIKPRL